MLKNKLAIICASAAISLTGGQSANAFSELVAFSGALSDTGNYAAEMGDRPAPFYQNRTANGPVAVEELARWLGLEAKASMHLVGKQEGTNFAVADALAGGQGAHDLPAEVDAYLASNGGKADPDALYFMFIGGNDVILAAGTMDDAQADKILSDAVQGIETQIKRLVSEGAKTIFAPDFIDVGLAPALTAYGPEAAARASALSNEYNNQFNAMLDSIDDGSFELVRWSFDDFVKKLMKNGPDFGFANSDTPCLDAGEDCNMETYVFLTKEYPTARVHQMLGSAMALAILNRD